MKQNTGLFLMGIGFVYFIVSWGVMFFTFTTFWNICCHDQWWVKIAIPTFPIVGIIIVIVSVIIICLKLKPSQPISEEV